MKTRKTPIMKNLLSVFAVVLVITIVFGCQKQARDILRSDLDETTLKAAREKLLSPSFEAPENLDFVKGEVMFRLRDNNSLSRVVGKSTTKYNRTKAMERAGHNGYYKILIAPGREKEVQRQLRNNPNVQWAELNYIVHALGTPDDTYWNNGELYGMKHINADSAWLGGNFGSKDIALGITDEGVFPHEDLCKNIWRNEAEFNGAAGVDDDQNGYIDDFHGYNFLDNNNQIYMGGDKHGTHVAGSMLAKGGNGYGVIGVMSNATLVVTKFLQGSGSIEHAMLANDYQTDLVYRHNLKLVANNNSWGGSGVHQGYIESVHRAGDAGIIQTYAAGNSSNNNDIDPSPSFPGAYTHLDSIMVGVIATEWTKNKVQFSSYGQRSAHIAAPGTGIVSTVPTDQHTSGFAYFSGTSMASPHVNAAIGLYYSVHPELFSIANRRQRALMVKAALLASATSLDQLKPYCRNGNFLNVASFVGQTPEHPPAPPDCPTFTPDNNAPSIPGNFEVYEVGFDPRPGPFYGGYFGVRWNPSTDPEGGPVGYALWMNNVSTWWVPGTNYVIAGIQDTTQPIPVWVQAIDAWGNPSPFSNKDTVIWNQSQPPPPTDTEPPSVVVLTVGNPQLSSLNLNWTQATDNSGSVVYDVYRNGSLIISSLQGTAYTNTGLSSGTTYSYYIKPRDPAGNTSQSNTESGTTLSDNPPPPPCVVNSLFSANASGMNVNLNWSYTISGDCSVQSTRIERKKGKASSTDQYVTVQGSVNASSPFQTVMPGNGFWTYRLVVVTTVGEKYSDPVTVKASNR